MHLCGWRWGSWILLGLVGCTPVEPANAPVPETATPECTVVPDRNALPVVTTIQTRDHEITVHAGDNGLRFTVALAGGVVLGHQITEGEFQQSFPGLHQRFSSAFAGDEAWLDASVSSPSHALRSTIDAPGVR
ncbi:MAG: hypothetical protein AAGF11_16515 [Myxococcota bacterium]